jgi:hypothetical protein
MVSHREAVVGSIEAAANVTAGPQAAAATPA